MPARRANQELINRNKITFQTFAVPADENEALDKYLDLTRELKILCAIII